MNLAHRTAAYLNKEILPGYKISSIGFMPDHNGYWFTINGRKIPVAVAFVSRGYPALDDHLIKKLQPMIKEDLIKEALGIK